MTVQTRPQPGKYKLTVEDFLRLDETGVFGSHRTELLDGDIIIMNAEYRPHGRIKDELTYRIRRKLEEIGSELFPMSASVIFPDHSMPLPDIVLTRESEGEGPIPFDSIALIIEVSASTLKRDAVDKLVIYANARVPEYMIVDVEARSIRRLWNPTDLAYSSADEISFGEPLASNTIPALTISTAGL